MIEDEGSIRLVPGIGRLNPTFLLLCEWVGNGMKGIRRRTARGTGRSPRWAGWVMAGALLAGGVRVDAAPIHHEALSPAEATAFEEWSHYLKAGPKFWEHVIHPAVTPAIRASIWESVRTDPGGADPMVRFLLWKQSLDPTRFAYYHPKLAPALHKIARSTPSAPQLLNPPPGSSTGPQPPPAGNSGGNPTSPIPEPSTLLLAAGMAGWAVWRTRRRNEKP
jgi:hypothetical protein